MCMTVNGLILVLDVRHICRYTGTGLRNEPTEEGIYEYLLENGYQPYYADANGVTGVAFEAQNGTEISFAFPAVDDEIVQFSVYSSNEETARAYARDLFSSISLR